MKFDAIVLAGGRSRRLDGADKSAFVLAGTTLLERACQAVSEAQRIVIVGTVANPPDGAEVVRENPPFGGPAAGIGAGLAALGAQGCDLVAILACDLPYAGAAFAALHAVAVGGFDADGVIAADDSGRQQTLLGIYRTASLRTAVDRAGGLDGLSVRTLVAGLTFLEVPVPEGSTLDIDTWHDVEQWGIERKTKQHEADHD